MMMFNQIALNNSKLLLLKVQFQLPLKLIKLYSDNIAVESSIHLIVEQILTTVLLSLVMEMMVNKTTILLETHGELDGETKAISE